MSDSGLINNGISGDVFNIPTPMQSLWGVFWHANQAVRKQYKDYSFENPFPVDDFKNEVAILNLLNHYRDQLPFSIPQVINYGQSPKDQRKDYVAFLDMTKLRNADLESPTDQSYEPEKTKIMGQTLVHFHKLLIKRSDQIKLIRDPLSRLGAKLERHLCGGAHSDMIVEASALLKELTGPKVFLHGDLHPANTCTDNTGRITGVMDFCYSGFGVKELDFLYYAEQPDHLKAAIDGYEKNGGDNLCTNNLALIQRIAPIYLALRDDMANAKKIMDSKPVMTQKIVYT